MPKRMVAVVRWVAQSFVDLLVIPLQMMLKVLFSRGGLNLQVHDYRIYGHFALATEVIQSQLHSDSVLGIKSPKVFWSIGYQRRAVNRQLFKMVRRELTTLPPAIVSSMLRNGSRLPALAIPLRHESISSIFQNGIGVLNDTNPQMTFNERELKKFQMQASRLGIHPVDKIVCLYIRDHQYLSFTQDRVEKANFRNMDVSSFAGAVDYLCQSGYKVIRMGKYVAHPFPFRHENFIDYAVSDSKSDELDLYLPFISKLGITTGTGMDTGSLIFRKPTLLLGVAQLVEVLYGYAKLWWRPRLLTRKGKMLTASEILSSGVGYAWRDDEFRNLGITIVDLKPIQILESVKSFEREASLTVESRIMPTGNHFDSQLADLIEKAYDVKYVAHLCSSFANEYPSWKT